MRLVYWFIIVIAIISIVYVWMLLDTNPIKDYVLLVMDGSIDDQGIVGKRYSGLRYSDAVYWDNSILRIFMVHNFSDGIMWVKYSRHGYRQNGGTYGFGSNVLSKWIIHKENGRWKVVDIDEHP